jgi:hypothetical protein
VGIEPEIPARERPQANALYGAVTIYFYPACSIRQPAETYGTQYVMSNRTWLTRCAPQVEHY